MGKKDNGKWSPNILADYCLSLIRETPTGEYKEKRRNEYLMNFFKLGYGINRHRLLFDTIYRN